MRATVDKDLCLGCGVCVDICPEVFQMEEDKAVAKVAEVPAGAEGELLGLASAVSRSRRSRLKNDHVAQPPEKVAQPPSAVSAASSTAEGGAVPHIGRLCHTSAAGLSLGTFQPDRTEQSGLQQWRVAL